MTGPRIKPSSAALNFNPHEREARDKPKHYLRLFDEILIHTSVKLVTCCEAVCTYRPRHFNPHEREARDLNFPFVAFPFALF